MGIPLEIKLESLIFKIIRSNLKQGLQDLISIPTQSLFID